MTTQADTATITQAMFNEWAGAYRKALYKVAHDLMRGSHYVGISADDLVQEGLLHAWTYAAPKWAGEGNHVTWLFKGARWGMAKVLYRIRVKKGGEQLARTRHFESGDPFADTEVTTVPEPDFAEALADRVTVAQANADITLALQEVLSPMQQKWVHLRFWEGMTPAEIAREAGIASSYWAQRDKGIKAKLAERLAYLQEASV